MISCRNKVFKLDTPNTSYLFRISETGHAEHLYYGPGIVHTGDVSSYIIYSDLRMPTLVNYSDGAPRRYPAIMPLELSSMGKGDLREPVFQGEWGAQGNTVFDFTFESWRVEQGDSLRTQLPAARKEGAKTLVLVLRDLPTRVCAELRYTVYPDSDAIVRRTVIRNDSGEPLTIRALYSLQLDLDDTGFELLTFDGAWSRERHLHRTRLGGGFGGVQSVAGVSSAEHNPLFLLKSGEECFLFNLLWSGDHRELAEVSPYGMVRVLTGLNPASFSWRLEPGACFASPEAVMAYSAEGENAVSQTMHDFVRRYISPPVWRDRERPVLLNSWEGMGFALSEEKVKRQAACARDLGIELFVIDDGWFRENDCAQGSMGDWQAAEKRFPRGLRPVCDYLHSLGMLAGIWIEPEMISPDSGLCREHPDFLVQCPGRAPSPGRDQYLLDMSRAEVTDILFEKLERLIAENGFDYIKWDMNRYLADDYSAAVWIPEFRFRWILGLYRLLDRLTRRFPELLIEGCASGGGRFDLGMLCYVSQFWGSDNTDATERVDIFTGTSYGYPQCAFGAHVSRIPNGITGRVYDYETAFHVNAFGAFGYELDVTKLTDFERDMFREQIAFYKRYRKVFQFGTFTRAAGADGGNAVIWTCGSQEDGVILALYLERRMGIAQSAVRRLVVPACRPEKLYRVTARRQWVTNALMCGKRGGPHRSEAFSCVVSGALLRCRGMTLMPVFQGTDYPENAAYLGDYGSRLFVIEECGA